MQQKNNYHLAIDIGASSGRHILGYEENGILKTEEIYRFQNGPVEKAGTAGALGATGAKRLTWDAARLYSEILNGLKHAKEPVPGLAICVSNTTGFTASISK